MSTILQPGYVYWDGFKYVLNPLPQGPPGPPGPPGTVPVDPLRPRFTALLNTNDNASHTVNAVSLAMPNNTVIEASALVVANNATDGAIFYIHGAFRVATSTPILLTYHPSLSSPQQKATTDGATSWTAVLALSGNTIVLNIQEPGGSNVEWTVEVQYTIGNIPV